ncbi:17483_t:CDS:1, partial [Racocetra fulgida]
YELPCTLAPSVSLHEGSGLLDCETKDSQTIRHADSKLAKNRLPLYNSFFPELVQIQTHLEDFSLCEKHYNQLIISDFLRQVLLNANYSNKQNRQAYYLDLENELVEKQARTEHAYEMEVEKNTCEIGVQTDEIDNTSHTLENDIFLLQAQLNIKVSEIENLKKQLEYAYDYVVESWGQIQEINKINNELSEKNKELKSKWENRFNSQKKRINSIVQIANYERKNIYNDIESLILNKQRFSLN